MSKPKINKVYEIKPCSICKGKGTVKRVVELPGTFDVQMTVQGLFTLKWNDAVDETAAQVEKDLQHDFKEALKEFFDEGNAIVSKKTIDMKFTVTKR